MNWVNENIIGLSYWLDFIGNILPIILAVAIIFTFFLVQSFGRQLKIMSFYLDRIDNHLREISYLMKEKNNSEDSSDNKSQDYTMKGGGDNHPDRE